MLIRPDARVAWPATDGLLEALRLWFIPALEDGPMNCSGCCYRGSCELRLKKKGAGSRTGSEEDVAES